MSAFSLTRLAVMTPSSSTHFVIFSTYCSNSRRTLSEACFRISFCAHARAQQLGLAVIRTHNQTADLTSGLV
jgi:hypothetical protein